MPVLMNIMHFIGAIVIALLIPFGLWWYAKAPEEVKKKPHVQRAVGKLALAVVVLVITAVWVLIERALGL
ncbi:hypothetical protein [Paenibacillus fonticola]|uniref:hypothetical protein n=1 Tax=Paenibacillus fonticola TaxID=379896 RepID=UPI0003707AC9|nr:hypothetical protein [Paenibacillus fonticola]